MTIKSLFNLSNIAILIGLLAGVLLLQIIMQRLIRRSADLFRQDDEDETTKKKRNKIKKVLITSAAMVNLAFFFYMSYSFIITKEKTLSPWFRKILRTYGKIIIYAVLIYAAYNLGTRFLSRLLKIILHKTAFTNEAKQRADLREQTLTHVLSYILVVVLSIFFIYEVLTSFGINLTPVLATAGLASLAIGFGAQHLVKDYVNGFFIILEDQYAVGDVVNVNGQGGFVERLTLRITQLRNTFGTVITIPNGEITAVQNFTKDWSRIDFTIGVDYATDVKKALTCLKEELEELKKEMPEDVIEPPGQTPDVLALDSFGGSSLNLRIWFKTKPLRQWAVQRKYNERILDRFNREGIVIPFPQSTISIRDELDSQLKQLVK